MKHRKDRACAANRRILRATARAPRRRRNAALRAAAARARGGGGRGRLRQVTRGHRAAAAVATAAVHHLPHRRRPLSPFRIPFVGSFHAVAAADGGGTATALPLPMLLRPPRSPSLVAHTPPLRPPSRRRATCPRSLISSGGCSRANSQSGAGSTDS